jgi:hypothetical protein
MKYMNNDYGHFVEISEDINQPNTILEQPKNIKKIYSKNNITIYLFDNTIMISCNKYFMSGFVLFLIVLFIRYYQNKIYIFS